MRAGFLVPLLLLLTACNRQSAAEKAAADARDIAAVEAAQELRPPAIPITLQPITAEDERQFGFYAQGCALTGAGGTLFMAEPARAAIKPKDELVVLASDPGSASMPQGTWSRYVGKEYALTVTRSGENTQAAAEAGETFPAKIVITDPFDQIVFETEGQIQCGA